MCTHVYKNRMEIPSFTDIRDRKGLLRVFNRIEVGSCRLSLQQGFYLVSAYLCFSIMDGNTSSKTQPRVWHSAKAALKFVVSNCRTWATSELATMRCGYCSSSHLQYCVCCFHLRKVNANISEVIAVFEASSACFLVLIGSQSSVRA